MSRVPHATFAHSDPADLDRELSRRAGSRVLVAVESIYSVLGDAAPLADLVAVCARHDALLVVDEAHGIGVAGQGRGLVAELGLVGAPNLVVTMTLSKSLGSQGGAVLAPPAVREHLVNTARSFIFDTGLAPAAAAAARAAADIVAADPRLAARVRAHAEAIAATLGIDPAAGAVQSLPMPSPEAAVAACLDLRAARRARRLLPASERARRHLAAAGHGARRPRPRRRRRGRAAHRRRRRRAPRGRGVTGGQAARPVVAPPVVAPPSSRRLAFPGSSS